MPLRKTGWSERVLKRPVRLSTEQSGSAIRSQLKHFYFDSGANELNRAIEFGVPRKPEKLDGLSRISRAFSRVVPVTKAQAPHFDVVFGPIGKPTIVVRNPQAIRDAEAFARFLPFRTAPTVMPHPSIAEAYAELKAQARARQLAEREADAQKGARRRGEWRVVKGKRWQ